MIPAEVVAISEEDMSKFSEGCWGILMTVEAGAGSWCDVPAPAQNQRLQTIAPRCDGVHLNFFDHLDNSLSLARQAAITHG